VITVEQARAALTQAVEQRGADYVYNMVNGTCVYNDNGPSCIVGQAVYNIDPELFNRLAEEESERRGNDGDGLVVGGIESLEFDFVAKQALGEAQHAQDNRKSWGEALEVFESTVNYWNSRINK